jgi:hypothetical protein
MKFLTFAELLPVARELAHEQMTMEKLLAQNFPFYCGGLEISKVEAKKGMTNFIKIKLTFGISINAFGFLDYTPNSPIKWQPTSTNGFKGQYWHEYFSPFSNRSDRSTKVYEN